jgi:hypothetical protein
MWKPLRILWLSVTLGDKAVDDKSVPTVGDAAQQPEAHPLGDPVIWDRGSTLLEVAADRTFQSVLHRIIVKNAKWVIIVRHLQDSGDVYYYAFRSSELEDLAANHPERLGVSIERAIEMHEWMSSRTARGGRPLGPAVGSYGPASARIVDFNAVGQVVAVGER